MEAEDFPWCVGAKSYFLTMCSCRVSPGSLLCFSLLQANRDYVVGQIMLACSDIIKTVQSREGAGGAVADPGFMAATINKVRFAREAKDAVPQSPISLIVA